MKATVGQIVHFWFTGAEHRRGDHPLVAIITSVHEDRSVKSLHVHLTSGERRIAAPGRYNVRHVSNARSADDCWCHAEPVIEF